MNRRDLLRIALILGSVGRAAAAFAATSEKKPEGQKSLLIGGLNPKHVSFDAKANKVTPGQDIDTPGMMQFYDFATGRIDGIPIGFTAHGFAQDAQMPERFATAHKMGRRGAVVNYRTREVIRLKAPEGSSFYGHVHFATDGLLYATAVGNEEPNPGSLLALDPANGRIVRSIPTGGSLCHEFVFLDHDLVVVSNSSKIPSANHLAWISLKEGKVIRTEKMPGTGHIRMMGQDRLLTSFLFRTNLVPFSVFDLKTNTWSSIVDCKGFDKTPYLESEALSTAVIEDDLVVTTATKASSLLFWRPKAKTFHRHQFGDAVTLGVAWHDSALWMTTFDRRLLRIEIDTKDLTKLKATEVATGYSNSSHVIAVRV